MKYITTLFFILISVNLFSQNFAFQLFGSKDGLEVPDLNCVFQDSRGYLWLGGVNGITKYNGKNFINYNTSNGLADNIIFEISEGSNHNLWISTKSGISSFNGSTFINYKIEYRDTSINNQIFMNVTECSDGSVYAGGLLGLFKLNKQANTFTQIKEIDAKVKEITEDKKGTIWIASDKGLYSYKNNEFTQIQIDTSISGNNLTCFALDNKGLFWLGTANGIVRYDGKINEKYFTSVNTLNRMRDICISSDNKILFTSDSPEIKIFENGTFSTIDLSYLINKATINRIIQDKEGNFWLASTAGLIKMYSKKFSKYALTDSIKVPVLNIVKDKTNTMFFASTEGLYKQQGNKLTKYNVSKNPDEQYMTCLLATDSSLLIGTLSGQTFKFCNNSFLAFGNKDYEVSNPVYQILAQNDALWICKQFNVIEYNKKKYTVHNISFPINGFTQTAMVDSKNKLWFANSDKLTTYENGKFKVIGEKDGFNFRESATLSEDNSHNIWIGTYGFGLIKFDGKTYKAITTNDGLASNYICSSLFDKKANTLWIGSLNGVSQIKLNDNGNVQSITNYNREHGLESLNCNQSSVFQLPNSNILFGIENTVYEYNSNISTSKNIAPQINFSGLRLFYETPEWTAFSDSVQSWSKMPLNLVLPYNKNYLTFDFIGISLDAPENVKYQWMLDGFDKDWCPISKNIFTTYSNLPSGKFTFKVKACNSAGVWSVPKSYSFIITPPYYNTWWFYTICIILIIAISYLLYNYKINQLKRQQVQKLKQLQSIAESELKAIRSQLNPHFMFNVLSAIQDVYLDKDEEKAQLFIAEFASLMRGLLQNSSKKEISLEEEIEFIKKYIELEKIRLGDKFQYEIQIDEAIDPTDTFIPPMLLQPFIENAINHGLLPKQGKGLLTINFALQNTSLCITIIDNGIGRKASALRKNQINHSSMAISLIKERLEILSSMNDKESYTYVITDLTEGETAIGTRVMITLPKN